MKKMKNLEKLNNKEFCLISKKEQNYIIGGLCDRTMDKCYEYTNASETYPCGDTLITKTFDGSWKNVGPEVEIVKNECHSA